jgi:hypothetical protein
MAAEILDNDLEEATLRNVLPGAVRAELISIRPDEDPQLSGLEFDATERRVRLREAGYAITTRELQRQGAPPRSELIVS